LPTSQKRNQKYDRPKPLGSVSFRIEKYGNPLPDTYSQPDDFGYVTSKTFQTPANT